MGAAVVIIIYEGRRKINLLFTDMSANGVGEGGQQLALFTPQITKKVGVFCFNFLKDARRGRGGVATVSGHVRKE